MAQYTNILNRLPPNAVGRKRIQSIEKITSENFYVTGATIGGTPNYTLTLGRNGGLSDVTVNLSSLVQASSSPLTTKGDIYVFGSANTRLPVGTNSYALVADSSTATGLNWAPNSDANYYTASAAINSNIITGTVAGGGNNWTVDISGLTSVGTIATGIWSGTSIVDGKIASATNWNDAYNNYVASAAYNAGTLTFTQRDGGTFTASGFETGTMSSWTVRTDTGGGGAASVTNAAVVDFVGNDGITTSNSGLSASWSVDNTVVRTTGVQSIGGTKTFTSLLTASNGLTVSAGSALTVSGNTTLQNPLIIQTGSATKFNFKPDDQAEELLITGTKKTTAATEYAYYPRIVLDSDEDADALSQPGYPSVFFTKFGPTSIANPAGDPVGWRMAASGSAGIASAPQSLVWDYSSDQSTYSNKLILSEAGVLTAATFTGQLLGTIASTTTATTQSAGNSTTKVATTAFVAAAVGAGGGGDVSKVGTPVDNQLAVWTGANTIEGDADMTFDGTNLTLANNLYASKVGGQGDTNNLIDFSTADTQDFNIDSKSFMKFTEVGSSGDTIVFNEDSKNIDFRIESDDDANMFVMDAGSNAIGIGTASPARKFEVNYGASSGYMRIVGQNKSLLLGQDSVGAAIYQEDNAPMYFATNNATRMTIAAGGNVGIGTGSPPNALSVWKAINNDFVAELKNTHATAGQSWGLQVCAGTNSSDAALVVENEAENTSLLYVRGDGNVGINTTAPESKLHINGGAYLAQFSRGTGDFTLIQSNDTNNLIFATGTPSSNTEIMTINSTGVGVSTTNPIQPLHVLTSANDKGILIDVSDNTHEGRLIFGDVASNGVGHIGYNHSMETMRFTVGGFETVRMAADANYKKLFLGADSTLGFYRYGNRMDFYVDSQPRIQLDTGTLFASNATGAPSIDLFPSAGTATYGFYGDTDTGLDRTGADTLVLLTAGTARMTISSAGNATFTEAVTLGSNSVTNTQSVGNSSTRLATTEFVAAAVAAGGNVSKVGTPANNQIGVWTGDGTIEGNNDFTYDAGTLDIPMID